MTAPEQRRETDEERLGKPGPVFACPCCGGFASRAYELNGREVCGFCRGIGPDGMLTGRHGRHRPAWAWDPPEGYHLEPVVSPEWRIAVDEGKRCRFVVGPNRKACGAPAELALRRGTRRPAWWGYCWDHAFGRWIEDGKVYYWRAVPNEAEDAE